MFKKNLAIYCFISFLMASCTKFQERSDDPKSRLTGYINKSFSVKDISDKNELISYLTGDAKTRLGGWSEEQFRTAFIDSKREFLKLSFREVKTISASEVQVTYELTYHEGGKRADGKTHDAQVTNKKLCRMLLENGKWQVADVRNIKELVEYQNELSLP